MTPHGSPAYTKTVLLGSAWDSTFLKDTLWAILSRSIGQASSHGYHTASWLQASQARPQASGFEHRLYHPYRSRASCSFHKRALAAWCLLGRIGHQDRVSYLLHLVGQSSSGQVFHLHIRSQPGTRGFLALYEILALGKGSPLDKLLLRQDRFWDKTCAQSSLYMYQRRYQSCKSQVCTGEVGTFKAHRMGSSVLMGKSLVSPAHKCSRLGTSQSLLRTERNLTFLDDSSYHQSTRLSSRFLGQVE